MTTYTALVGLNSKKKRYEAGDIVTEKDFPKSVLKHWAKIGRIKLKSKKKEGADGNG